MKIRFGKNIFKFLSSVYNLFLVDRWNSLIITLLCEKIFSWSFYLNSAGKMDSHTLNHYQYEFKLFYVPLTMETIKIELKNKNALSILKSLERAKIIRLVSTESQTKNSPVHFKGAISPDRAIELANEIEKSRNEWDERTT